MQQGITAAEPLKKFIEGLRALLTGSRAEAETVHAVKDRLVGLLETPGWLPDPCRVGDPSCYARHLLYQDSADGFVMVAMVWGAGQRTAIHDHAGVWCVEGVYEGRIQVTRFDL